ncbi:MAG: DUF58 domain-containing protein [Rhodothermales bacterium]
MFKKLGQLYFGPRLFWTLAAVIVLFVSAYFAPVLLPVARVALALVIALAVADLLLLFGSDGVSASRVTPRRLSNGDDNRISISLENLYRFASRLSIVDELPKQFQIRDNRIDLTLPSGHSTTARYTVRPTMRGSFEFGAVNVFAESPIGFVQRRYRFDAATEVPVYPSYIQMRKYAFMAISDRLTELGVKQVRRVGHTMEFDQIRPYVMGDDYRTVNWKATSRSRRLMVNQYQDERSQQVYCLVDMGRVMKMPFEGLTLLDYAINASLALSNVSVLREDKAGLVTFSDKVHTVLPASRKGGQMARIMELLYRQETDFKESSYERLYASIARNVKTRSLLLLFTNFETRTALRRQLTYLRSLAARHLLVVILFENTELEKRLKGIPGTLEEVYIKTISEQFAVEKREIIAELKRYGIHAVLTPPEELTVNTINAYLEMKARRLL